MLITKRQPATVGEILNAEFIAPLAHSQGAVAVTARAALILGRVFGDSAEFWLNVQRRSDPWEA